MNLLETTRQNRFLTISTSLLLGFLIVDALVGCGRKAPTESNAVTQNATSQLSPSQPSQGEIANPSDLDSLEQGLAQSIQPNVANATNTQTSSGIPSVASNQSAQVAPVPPVKTPEVVKPTEQQIAKWSRRPFERLDMLNVADINTLGLVTCIDKLPDGKHYVMGGARVTLWSIVGKKPEHVLYERSNSDGNRMFSAIVASPDGKWIAAGDTEGRLKVFSVADRKEVHSRDLYTNDIVSLAISPDSKLLASMTYGDEISIWDITTLKAINKFKAPDRFLKKLEFITATELAIAGEKTTCCDVTTGKLVRELSPGKYRQTLARSLDNKRLAFGVDESLCLWDIEQSKIVKQIPIDFGMNSLLEISPNGEYLAAAGGSLLRVIDLTSGQTVEAIDILGRIPSGLEWLPNSNLMVIAFDMSGARIWGPRSKAEELGMQPIHTAWQPIQPDVTEPVHREQMLATFDLRTFPTIPDSKINMCDDHMLMYEASVGMQEATTFYRYLLVQNGWTELPQSEHTPNSYEFERPGMKLNAYFNSLGDAKTQINLTSSNRIDLRALPQWDLGPIKNKFEHSWSVNYEIQAKLFEIEAWVLRKFHAVGWTPYARLNSTHNEENDSRSLEFLRNATVVHVYIKQSQDDPDSFHIQYSTQWANHAIPVPPDSGFVEFDGSVEPHLVATTSMNMKEARDFYDAAMKQRGWLVMDRGRSIQDSQNWLAYMHGLQEFTVGLTPRADHRTLIRVGKGLENSSWQLSTPKQTSEAEKKAGIEAADFPVLNSSRSAKYDLNARTIEVQLESPTLASASDAYTAELSKVGFMPGKSGVRSEEYTLITFSKEQSEINFRASRRQGLTTIQFEGNGLLWSKPLPVPPEPISFEAWLRKHRHPSGLSLLDKYLQEMRELSSGQKTPSN